MVAEKAKGIEHIKELVANLVDNILLASNRKAPSIT
jgi:hypothetical protein